MNVLDELKSMQAELNRIEDQIASLDEQKEELKQLAGDIKKKMEFASRVAQHYEEAAQEKAMFDSEAFARLYVKILAQCGSALDDDVKQCAEQLSIELPDELKQATDEEEAEEVAALAS